MQVIIKNSLLKTFQPSLPYGKLKIEIWAFKLLLSLKKGLNGGKNHNSKYIGKFGHQNPFKKSSLISMLPHHIIIESSTQ